MKKPLWVESKYCRAVALEDGTGKTYHLCHVSHLTCAYLLIYDPDRDFAVVPSAELKDASPLFGRIDAVVQTGGFLWDVPAYRSLCVDLGFDPDRGRPIYKAEDVDVVLRLRDALKWTQGGGRKTSLLAYDLLELLRTNERPEFQAFERCREAFRDWSTRRPKRLFREAFERIDLDRIGSSTSVGVGITFLPSWEGTGFTSTISLWAPGCESDGWSRRYSNLRGVAVRPGKRDLMIDVAVRRLTEQGVVFLSPNEARAYMDGEGAYWSARQGFAICPRELEPRMPTLAEKLGWRFRRPETPLFDRYVGRNAA